MVAQVASALQHGVCHQNPEIYRARW